MRRDCRTRAVLRFSEGFLAGGHRRPLWHSQDAELGYHTSMTKTLVNQVLTLPPADRLDLMDQIWESLAQDPEAFPLPEEHRRLLEERLERHRAAPERVVAWESVRGRYVKPQ